MAAVKKWICDGCDDAVETELEADTCSFYQIKVTMGAWGKDLILCTKCHRGGDTPHRQKTLTSVRIDYQTASASSLTVQATDDLGETYQTGIGVSLPPASIASHVRADVYSAGRYPAFKVSSVGARYRLWRFWATIRTQGR